MPLSLAFLKVLYCLPFLFYACWSDWKTRRVSNRLWLVMAGLGTPFLALDPPGGLSLAVSVVFVFVFAYLAFEFGLFGGADAKALIVLAYLFPVTPTLDLGGVSMPFMPSPGLFALSVLGNGLVFSLVVPLAILIRNLKSGVKKPLRYIFIGYRLPVSELRGHLRLMEEPVETEKGVEFRYKRGGIPLDVGIAKLRKLAKKDSEVWVTPAIPFIIPLTLGFLTAIVYGDIIFNIIKGLLIIRG